MAVSLRQDLAQKRPAHNNNGTIGRSLLSHQEDGCSLEAKGM